MNPELPRTRLAVVGLVVIALFGALFSRLWFLQVLSAPSYRNASTAIRLKEVQLEPRRGRVLDAAGRPLADNRTYNVVLIDRDELRSTSHRTQLFAKLAPILNTTPDALTKRMNNSRYNTLRPLPAAEDVPDEALTYLAEHVDDFPGVYIGEGSTRIYPYGSTASHVLGYVGQVTKEDIDAHKDDNYQAGETIGKDGVERTFERDLRGVPGKDVYEVDNLNRIVRTISHIDPQPGSDVQLTINVDVQYLAEQVLQQTLAARRKVLMQPDANKNRYYFPAPAGSVVILDPNDSSVIAMASYPTFDQRDFASISSKDYAAQFNDPTKYGPLTNRAASGLYAPGSAFKLVTATTALVRGVVKSDEIYKDTGSYTIEKCTIDCQRFNAQKVTWGPLDIKRAITVSSDVYFYRIGDKLGGQDAAQYGPLNAIQDTARSYGFGSPTGIALPNEPDGRVPDAKLKTALHKENPTAFPFGDWLTGDNVNLAVGQGLLVVTPLQLANAYGMFANGGQRYQPRIAKSVNAPGGQVHVLGARKVGDPMVFTSDVRDSILTGMKGVVANREGTAVDAFSGFNFAKFDLAGKTGTAEVQSIDPNTKRRNADTSVFVAFGPVAAPKFVVSVVLEQSGFGSEAAAPAVRRIFDTLYGFAAPVLAPRVAEGDKMPDAPDLHILFPPEKNVLPD